MMVRGRAWVTLWLLYFLAVLAVVVARQTSSVVAASELRTLQEERRILESRRNDLLIRIREGRSRARLIPRAEELGLRLPVDSEIVTLEVVRPVR
jgi:hypothetical protein